MKKYTVVWTYIANHGVWVRWHNSAEEAVKELLSGFSDDFKKKGKYYIFEGLPDATNDEKFEK